MKDGGKGRKKLPIYRRKPNDPDRQITLNEKSRVKIISRYRQVDPRGVSNSLKSTTRVGRHYGEAWHAGIKGAIMGKLITSPCAYIPENQSSHLGKDSSKDEASHLDINPFLIEYNTP